MELDYRGSDIRGSDNRGCTMNTFANIMFRNVVGLLLECATTRSSMYVSETDPLTYRSTFSLSTRSLGKLQVF